MPASHLDLRHPQLREYRHRLTDEEEKVSLGRLAHADRPPRGRVAHGGTLSMEDLVRVLDTGAGRTGRSCSP